MLTLPLHTRPVHRCLSVAWLMLLGVWPCLSWSQAQGIVLRSSPRLQEQPSAAENRQGALHIGAERITMRPDMDTLLEGGVELRKPGLVVRADRLEYDQTQDRMKAQGQVRVSRQGHRFDGPSAELQLDSFQGYFDAPRYRLVQGGHGDARRIEFIDQDRMVVEQARYTTCRATPGPEWLPEWFMKAARIRTDAAEGTGVAEDAQLHFRGLRSPVLPNVKFPLEGGRSTGLLAPVVAIDSISGIDLMQPWYWDIAPNRDATLVARAMSRRGMGMEGEFRYLESLYSGQVRLNWLPNDALRQQSRWGLMTQHNGSLDTGIGQVGQVGVSLSIARVSDDSYWRDFPKSYLSTPGAPGAPGAPVGLTQRVLPSTGVVYWGRGDFSMVGVVQRWQTQQDVSSPITPPYDRAPQITMRYGKWNDRGFDWSIIGDTTRFEADYGRIPNASATTLASLRNGTRSYTQAQVSRPFVAPWGYITPKLQLHATRYDLQSALSDGNSSLNRVLPTFSLDTGLVFERETAWLGKNLVQPLEPRVFYARTAYQDQRLLPLYDTGRTDFNLATIYSENPYVGQDRIVDNNAVTFGVNSRFFDNNSGAELLRLGVAQRLRLTDQRVSLNAANAPEDQKGLSDLLLGAGTRWNEKFLVDGTVQLNNQTRTVQRTTLQARYNPGPYRLLNVAYRVNQASTNPSELVDVGWQWPLSDLRWGQRPDDSAVKAIGQGLGADRWYSVGRMNYSLQDKRPVDTLIGFEYDAGCWLGRVAFERLQSTVSTATTRLMFQLELVGFGRVGVSPLDALRRNIPRYQYLRENPATPSRFLQYE
ncbi:MAG: LPS-assembly protein LptD [Limnohabitans sp.]